MLKEPGMGARGRHHESIMVLSPTEPMVSHMFFSAYTPGRLEQLELAYHL